MTVPPPLFDRAFIDDPYPAYAWLREHAPVYRTRLPNGVEAYLVTRYDDAKAVLADARLSKNAATSYPEWRPGRTGIPGEHRSGIAAHLLNLDPPDHTRLRRLVSKAFTPRRVADFEPRVVQIADRLLDAFDTEPVDLIRAYAFPLPVVVICEMLGVPAEDQSIFHEWAHGMIDRSGPRGGVGRCSVFNPRGVGVRAPGHGRRRDLGTGPRVKLDEPGGQRVTRRHQRTQGHACTSVIAPSNTGRGACDGVGDEIAAGIIEVGDRTDGQDRSLHCEETDHT